MRALPRLYSILCEAVCLSLVRASLFEGRELAGVGGYKQMSAKVVCVRDLLSMDLRVPTY